MARDHPGLWRCAGREQRERLVHAALFRHLERLADRYRRGRLPAGSRQGETWQAAHSCRSTQDPGGYRYGPGRRAGDPAYWSAAEPRGGAEQALTGNASDRVLCALTSGGKQCPNEAMIATV